ncbi:MAG: orotidine-5'-phosphate decarboxylase [Bacteroidetes bacterium]|nr:orotidine-5'-phosphate decarboxylase [Bacteroidota bacterium]
MTLSQLEYQIRSKESFLCVGLDTDLDKIPSHLKTADDPIFEFNKAIIDATAPYCVAFKPNMAFYEAYGVEGWISLERTIGYLNAHYPDHFTIADAKRGDIGNTAERYAQAFYEELGFDSITISPYMGSDAIIPFLNHEEKYPIVLALTSNEGAFDFQYLEDSGLALYKKVVSSTQQYLNAEKLMYVVGATKADRIAEIRSLAPNAFFLVPGVGAQGGDLASVYEYGANTNVGLLVNSSRGIIYASNGTDFAQAAAKAACELQIQMKSLLLS